MAEFMPIYQPTKVFKDRRESREVDYRAVYRFSKVKISKLNAYFLGETEEYRDGTLSNIERMRVFLRYVSDQGFQIGIGEDIGVHQSTVSRTVTNVITRIVQNSNIWIRFPTSCEDLHNAKNKWQEKFNFPSAIGAIGCTHIPILKPFIHADEDVNRKNFDSINEQATCNSNEEFTSLDVSWPGSVHDSQIWENSDIYNVMKWNRASAVLLGDSGYGIASWLMTPFRIAETAEQRSYNRLFTIASYNREMFCSTKTAFSHST
ncbi:unnamed protein product [Acanthoscelides obtectus]|uniref:Putative nuclease HARBI1 n=1 Tax=Acanthoscelides obtectus TaxID=200917 RepID=A0A9P0L916_ACAOB|nr:unnamed protein product [Acanthoscelides obtectus]CAK1633017.1 Putative nuclease HARBI1 [Acanthoscelides obtectus]